MTLTDLLALLGAGLIFSLLGPIPSKVAEWEFETKH